MSAPTSQDNKDSVAAVDATAIHNKCPICLEGIEDRAMIVECRHAFCFECISHWIDRRNRCPLCRAAIYHIRHQVANASGVLVDEDVLVTPPAESLGYILDRGLFTMVVAPLDSPLHMVEPVQLPGTLSLRYSVRTLQQDHIYMVPNSHRGTLYVLPEALETVTAILHSMDITAEDGGVHVNEHGSTAMHSHPSFLGLHHVHREA